MAHQDALFVIQVAIIIVVAKLAGRFFQRVLKQPSVIGELSAGILIGPYALGGLSLFGVGPLFPPSAESVISPHLHDLSVIASVILLFLAGLETDLRKFLRFAPAGLMTGAGGALLCFVLGDAVTVWLGPAEHFMDPSALLMGTVATATSVGLSARVLSDKHQMDTAEGATILSAAVVDDVLGLILLGLVLAVTEGGTSGGEAVSIPWARLAGIAGKAIGFWVIAMGLGVIFARRISGFLKVFGDVQASSAAALALGLFLAGIAEQAGMALIIGAYVMGLSLSRTDLAHEIQKGLGTIYQAFVPVFFCVTGMAVDLSAIHHSLLLGAGFLAVAMVGKVLGCGLPALPMGFNLRGAARIGVGMMPRQEVAIIVAGIGLANGAISNGEMGAVILMVLATAIAAPPILARLFDGRSGRRSVQDHQVETRETVVIPMPSPALATIVADQFVRAFKEEGFYVFRLIRGASYYEFRKDEHVVTVRLDGDSILVRGKHEAMRYARFVVLEEMLTLEQAFGQASRLGDVDELNRRILGLPGEQTNPALSLAELKGGEDEERAEK